MTNHDQGLCVLELSIVNWSIDDNMSHLPHQIIVEVYSFIYIYIYCYNTTYKVVTIFQNVTVDPTKRLRMSENMFLCLKSTGFGRKSVVICAARLKILLYCHQTRKSLHSTKMVLCVTMKSKKIKYARCLHYVVLFVARGPFYWHWLKL